MEFFFLVKVYRMVLVMFFIVVLMFGCLLEVCVWLKEVRVDFIGLFGVMSMFVSFMIKGVNIVDIFMLVFGVYYLIVNY